VRTGTTKNVTINANTPTMMSGMVKGRSRLATTSGKFTLPL
jgi:hypothetical protein